MPIRVGDHFPDIALKQRGPDGLTTVGTGALLRGRKAVLFTVPGAFTPTCSVRHLSGFVERAAAFRDKGVDLVICLAANDPFVMDAWARASGVGDAVVMLPDGNGELVRALDLVLDARQNGMGERARRCAMVIEDGVVTAIWVEAPGRFETSAAEAVLAQI